MLKRVTRRELLRYAVLGTAAAAAGACTKTVEVTREVEKVVQQTVVVKETVVAKEEIKEVNFCQSWVQNEEPFDAQAAEYNALPEREQDKVRVNASYPGCKGLEDPVMVEMMAAGEKIPWSSGLTEPPFLALGHTMQLGTGQPYQPYIETTQYQDAAKRLFSEGAMLPSARADVSYKGVLWDIPIQGDVCGLMYRKDYFAAVGQNETPKTMDDLYEVCVAAQEKLKDQEVWGFGVFAEGIHRYPASTQQTFSAPENIYTELGLINILDEGWFEMMEWSKKCIDAGIVPKGWETAGGWELFGLGKMAAEITMHGEGSRAGMVFGFDKLAMVATPIGNPRVKNPGTMFWFSCAGLYKIAPYPQECADFLCWCMDTDRAVMNNAVWKAGKMGAWYANYDAKYLNPNDVTRNWGLTLLPLLEHAVPPPITPWYGMQMGKIRPYLVNAWKGEMGFQEAMQKAMDETMVEVEATTNWPPA